MLEIGIKLRLMTVVTCMKTLNHLLHVINDSLLESWFELKWFFLLIIVSCFESSSAVFIFSVP